MSVFSVHKNYSKKFPNFKRPKIIGYWSLDGDRQLHLDSSQLRYYVPLQTENVKLDLNEGMSQVQRKKDSLDDEKMDHILTWIRENYRKILASSDSEKWLQPDFVSNRGILSRIMKAPYEYTAGWIICAAKFRGTIYLCPFDTEDDKSQRDSKTEEDKIRASWGYKFEQYMLSDTPEQRQDTSVPVNESEEFCCVFRSRLNNHDLLYGAEMDGLCLDKKVEDPLPLDDLKFMELKTTKNEEVINYWFRSLSYWSQSFLVGVDRVVCGLKGVSNRIVHRLIDVSVSDLEKNSGPVWKDQYWNSAICLNHCDEFLKFIKRTVRSNYDQVIYKFEKVPKRSIVVTELSPTSSEFSFLPDWYTRLAQ